MAVDEDDIQDLAYGIVEDLLDDGVEYLAVAEAVSDNLELDEDDDEDEVTKKVAAEVQVYLDKLKKHL